LPGIRPSKRGRPRDESLTERRREEILGAATRIFARDGYDKTDLQVLADTMGVGKGTLYRYFPTKRDLFLAAADRGMVRLRTRIDEAVKKKSDPLEQVAAAIRAYLEFFDDNPTFVELLVQERAVFKDRKTPTYFQHRETNRARWAELYRGLIGAGRVRDIPVSRIMDVIGYLVYGAMFTNFFAGRARSPESQAGEILDIVFDGVLTARERPRWVAGSHAPHRNGRSS
jgi:AcrR family transcriptional regulator